MNEIEIFEIILEKISFLRVNKKKPIRVAINGIEGTGKTTFAIALTEFLSIRKQKAIHVSIDGYHHIKNIRYRQGRDSAKGYYEDSYDEKAFVEKVLLSSQLNTPRYTKAIHDLESDLLLHQNPINITHNAILVTDGAYLFKPLYRDHWDLKIYLKTDFETAMSRGVERDKNLFNGEEKAKEKYLSRYHAASKIYINKNSPEDNADLIIDNTNFSKLVLLKG